MVPDNDEILYFQKGIPFGDRKQPTAFRTITILKTELWIGWTELNPNFVGTDSLQNITAIAATPSAQNKVYYGTDQGKLYRISNATFINPPHQELTDNLFPNSGFITHICIDPIDANNIIVTFSNYNTNSIFYSDDAGSTWGKYLWKLRRT